MIRETGSERGPEYEYSLLMSSLHVSVSKHLLDEHFTVIWANDYYYKLIDYPKVEYEALFHNHCDEYYRVKDNMEGWNQIAEEVYRALEKGDRSYTVICPMDRKDGRFWCKIVGNFTDEIVDGCPVSYTVMTDVSDLVEKQKLEQALAVAEQANRAKSDFLSRMSHDIRTPMNAIIGMTNIAGAHLGDEDKVRDCLRKITISSQHLLGLINDVLDMSKIESGKMSLAGTSMSLPVFMENVVAIIQPAIKQKRQKFSVRLKRVVHEYFLADALRLRQIFINILSNASKFTPEGGMIELETEELGERDGVAEFEFTFRDDGNGMNPEFLEHIFDAFAREKDSRVDRTEGSGLGMAITKKLVDLFSGTIEVESGPGMGTTFRVRLPLTVEGRPVVTEKFPDLKILVADDDCIMCEYAVQTFAEIGVEADWVNDGERAVARVAEAGKAGHRYDAVILDWKMPGLSGLETARRIRAMDRCGIPILIMSAYDWSDIEREAREAGVNGFLNKPVFVSTLCEGLRRYVLGRTDSPERREDVFDFSGRRFLLAEDNEMNREIAVELLGETGADILCAGNGADCTALYEAKPAGFFDLILMDIQMPVMDGYTAAGLIRNSAKDDAKTIPILAMTADAFAEDIEHARLAGMNGHVAKPLDWTSLYREIGRVLRAGQTAAHRV